MWTLIIGVSVFSLFLILLIFLSKWKGYKAFLIISAFLAVLLGCVCVKFANEETVEWIHLICFSIPMICLFQLDDLKTKKQRNKETKKHKNTGSSNPSGS